jgi:MFS family permease
LTNVSGDVVDEFATPRPIAGWRIVFTAFCMAVFAWGLGFYALSVYAQYLAQAGHFSPALLSAASTWFFLLGAGALYAVDAAVARIGRRPAVLAGVLLLAGGAALLPQLRSPVMLFVVYGLMAFGWAATSGTASASAARHSCTMTVSANTARGQPGTHPSACTESTEPPYVVNSPTSGDFSCSQLHPCSR